MKARIRSIQTLVAMLKSLENAIVKLCNFTGTFSIVNLFSSCANGNVKFDHRYRNPCTHALSVVMFLRVVYLITDRR